jgi:hypothetical protein
MNITLEFWRDVKGYEGLYKVSNLGRVKSLDCFLNDNGGLRLRKGRILKQGVNQKGYKMVTLSKDQNRSYKPVHRLVAMAFPDLVDWTEDAKGKPFDEIQVNHKNEFDKADNCVDNLEWCTQDYNNKYGTRGQRAGEKISKALKGRKAPRERVEKMRKTITGRKYSEETKRKISQSQMNRSDCSKAVLQYTKDMVFVAEYPSQKEASRQTGICISSINDCCNNKIKTAGGYRWIKKN